MKLHRYFFQGLFVLVAATAWTGCDKDDDDEPANEYTLSGAASGAQEVPPVTTAATGNITGTYTKNDKMLMYTITWSGLSSAPQAMHFHGPAPAGVNAGVLIPITGYTAAAAGSVSGMATLTPSQDSALMAGAMYYNIHTPAHVTGEIRGQVIVTEN